MFLDVIKDKLLIKYNDFTFKPRQISQLYDWGFSRNLEERYFFIDKNIEMILPKLLNYFNKSKLEYSISHSCNLLVKKIFTEKDRFAKLLKNGKNYKNGKFDKEDYNNHLEFLNNTISRKLKDHQKKASYHLYLLGNGANFSVPGSGKTTVVLCIYEKLRLQNKVNNLFVVGPPSCFGPWKDEFLIVLGREPNTNTLAGGNIYQRKSEYYKSDKISELYLTTFQTLLRDQDQVCFFLKNKKINTFLIIDEAHYIKQVSGNWAKAVLKISKYSKFRCVLTGTPIPKSYTDLYNLIDFLWPEKNIVSLEEKVKLKILEEEKDYESAGKILKPNIGPLFYRVRKSELGLKPQIFHIPRIIQMNQYERLLYDAVEKKIKKYAKEEFLQNIELVLKLRRGRMIRLRQCLSYAKLLSSAIDYYKEDIFEGNNYLENIIYNYDKLEIPAKINYLINFIKELEKTKKKVVIWAYFIGSLRLIEKKIIELGFNCKKIIGETPVERTSIEEEETREKIIKEFIDKKSGLNILLANPAACAESISLHKTWSNAIYYDLSYNCAQYLQSLDRIHRVGGSEKISAHYYFLQYDKTIDSDILDNLKAKAKKMYDIIEEDYSIYSLDMSDEKDEINAYERLFLK